MEKNFRGSELFTGYFKDSSIWKNIRIFEYLLRNQLFIRLGTQINKTSLFFDFLDYFEFGAGLETIATSSEEKSEVFSDISSCEIDSGASMLKTEPIEDRYTMTDSISTV